ncbi:MAG: GatB/YqeY domain-containing protein [Gammaproteobacteria bacterium]|nr:GatB/YqeY domain-containing protein [Gammaproteobacteria bacterium]
MSLKEQIDSDIKNAMLNKQKDELRALRSVKSLILLAETEKGTSGDIDETTEMKLLAKAAKQRKESAEIYQKESRDDLAKKELEELDVIKRYLPEELSDSEIQKEITAIIEETGASSLKEMGSVMGLATKRLAGKADGKKIADIVKLKLS